MSTPPARTWSRNSLALLVMVLFPAFMQTGAFAHTSLEKYIRQEVSVAIREGTLDVKLQCVFPSDISLTERRHMDANGDGELSSDEKAAYLHDIQERAEKQVRILFNDKVMPKSPDNFEVSASAGTSGRFFRCESPFLGRGRRV